MIYFSQRETAFFKMIGYFVLLLVVIGIVLGLMRHFFENRFMFGGLFAVGAQLYVYLLNKTAEMYRKMTE